MIRKTTLALAAALAAALPATHALATGAVTCTASDGSGAEFGYEFGSVPALALLGATIRAGDKLWSTTEGDGAIPMIFAQGAYDGSDTLIDFADPEFSAVIASVRLISAFEGDNALTVGFLHIPGVGIFPLTCE